MKRTVASVCAGTILLFGNSMSANAAELYNDFYDHFNSASNLVKDGQNRPDDIGSWAYAANSADAFGGVIGFDRPAQIDTFSVIMSNWNGYDPAGSVGTATSGYKTDLTLELYEVDRTGTNPAPGTQLAGDTETHDIAARQLPTAANASFVGNGTDFVVDWDLGNLLVGDELLFMVRIDELLPGNTVVNSGVNSLNIAAAATGTPPDVTAGIDTDNGVYWRSDATGGDIARFEAGQVLARASGTPIPNPA
ncbi:hypothetical protein, partial [Rhodovibrio sodomensis]